MCSISHILWTCWMCKHETNNCLLLLALFFFYINIYIYIYIYISLMCWEEIHLSTNKSNKYFQSFQLLSQYKVHLHSMISNRLILTLWYDVYIWYISIYISFLFTYIHTYIYVMLIYISYTLCLYLTLEVLLALKRLIIKCKMVVLLKLVNIRRKYNFNFVERL